MIILTKPGLLIHATRVSTTATTMARILSAGPSLALTAMYVMTFTLSALNKWSAGMPAWFVDQFQQTWIARLPGGLPLVFHGLALLETLAALGFALSLLSGEFLRAQRPALWLSLLGSQFIFIIHAFGSRLTGHFDTAGWDFLYFIGTVVALYMNRRHDRRHHE